MRNLSFALAGLLAGMLTAPLFAMESPAAAGEPIEEITVTGDRDLATLRLQMLNLEKTAYEVFNQFNDDRRFEIHCSMHQPTGSRLEQQVCEPEFEIQAKRTHARHYFENMRDMINQYALGNPSPAENTPPVYVPPEAVIASQQQAYRAKLKQIAEQHPEFLEAIVEYSKVKEQYQRATGSAAK